MKVLLNPADETLVSFPVLGGDQFQSLTGDALKGKAVVAEKPDAEVTMMVRQAMKHKYNEFMDAKDYRRDLKWLHKALLDVEVGTEVGMKVTPRGAMSLDIPADARPDRAGDLDPNTMIAVGPNISPKALMNARGRVVERQGAKVLVAMDQGDLDRIHRATGKRYGKEISLPVGSVEAVV